MILYFYCKKCDKTFWNYSWNKKIDMTKCGYCNTKLIREFPYGR